MRLIEIDKKVCDCGAKTVGETQTHKHTNGKYNETRTFECGAVLRFSPNFRKLHNCIECPNSKRRLKFKAKRAAAKIKLIDFIQGLDVDEKFQYAAISSVDYVGE